MSRHHGPEGAAADAKLHEILLCKQCGLAADRLGVPGFHMRFGDPLHLNKAANGFGNTVANGEQAMVS